MFYTLVILLGKCKTLLGGRGGGGQAYYCDYWYNSCSITTRICGGFCAADCGSCFSEYLRANATHLKDIVGVHNYK